jgi:hypothetical protein
MHGHPWEKAMDNALRPMSTSQVLDRTFQLYRNNFVLFAGIAALTPALKLIVGLAQLRVVGAPLLAQGAAPNGTEMQMYLVRTSIAMLAGGVVYLVGTAFASSATIYAVSMVHLGKTTSIRESYSKIRRIFWRILGLIIRVAVLAAWPIFAGYLLIIAVTVGMALMIRQAGPTAAGVFAVIVGLAAFTTVIGGVIWMIYALCKYALAIPAATLEDVPGKVSIIRSKYLTQGRRGRIFLIYLLTFLMAAILTYVLETPALVASKMAFFDTTAHISTASLIWIYIAGFLGGTLAGPIATIAIALVYYDERVRREAFDLQIMMESIGQAPPSAGTAMNSAAPSAG